MPHTDPTGRFTVGLDLGKVTDFTALAIAEERAVGRRFNAARGRHLPEWAKDPDFAVPWLQRWPLRTPYHTIAADVAGLVAPLAAREDAEVQLFVDATGVGVAVLEMLYAQPAIRALGRRFVAVTITAGTATTPGDDQGWRSYHTPKKELVGAAQVALQRGKLKVATALPDAATLVQELRDFEVRITAAANAQFSHRDGAHDDLVLAVALALWGSRQREPSRRLVPAGDRLIPVGGF
jgi:hypothetical protein